MGEMGECVRGKSVLRWKVGRAARRQVTAVPPGLGPFKCFTDSAKLPPQVAFFMNEKRPNIHYINSLCWLAHGPKCIDYVKQTPEGWGGTGCWPMWAGVDGAAWLDLRADRVNKRWWTAAVAALDQWKCSLARAVGQWQRAEQRAARAGPALQPGWQLQRRVQRIVCGAVQCPQSCSALSFA